MTERFTTSGGAGSYRVISIEGGTTVRHSETNDPAHASGVAHYLNRVADGLADDAEAVTRAAVEAEPFKRTAQPGPNHSHWRDSPRGIVPADAAHCEWRKCRQQQGLRQGDGLRSPKGH